jgi:hypothetical protein
MNESEMKVIVDMMDDRIDGFQEATDRWFTNLEGRIVALERGLEAVLRRMEASTSEDDEPGWFGVTE